MKICARISNFLILLKKNTKNIIIKERSLCRRREEKNAMDLKEVMDQKNFVIVGDTLNEEKYASKIKENDKKRLRSKCRRKGT